MTNNVNTRKLLAEFLPEAQAIEFRDPPRSRRTVFYTLLTLIICIILWSTLSEIDKLVVARGRLVTPLPNLVVQPLEPGILKSIHVRVGQQVEKGEALAVLDPTFATADVSQLQSRIDTLSLQAQRLEAELEGNIVLKNNLNATQLELQANILTERQAAYTARLRQLDQTIEQLKASLATNKQNQSTLANRLNSLRELENMHTKLQAQDFSSRAQVIEIQDKRLEIERDYQESVFQEKEIDKQITKTQAERQAFSKSWRQDVMEKLSETLQQRDEILEQMNKARLRSELVNLTAPADAIVLEIGQKSVGSVVEEAEALFILVPTNAVLEAEVEVAPADIGELRVGDPARIKVDAYPFQKHGTMQGTVQNVSADTFSRQTEIGPTFYYLARIRLDNTHLERVPSPTRLLPGMTLSGEIITGKRSVISYFLYPVLRVMDESFRER